MTLSVKHRFTSAKTDGTDPTLIQASNWNDTHTIQLAANKLIGRLTAGTGDAEEIPLSAFMATLLAAADAGELAGLIGVHSTGDVKLTIKTVADTGWVMCNDGTIGNVSSGATTRANADTWDLYQLLYAIPDAYAPVVGGRGSSVLADWNGLKPITLTRMLGRSLAISGSGSGLTARALGAYLGEETHTLTKAESPTGLFTMTDPQHSHSYSTFGGGSAYAYGVQWGGGGSSTTGPSSTGITLTDHAGDGAHNNMQPTSFLNAMIKL